MNTSKGQWPARELASAVRRVSRRRVYIILAIIASFVVISRSLIVVQAGERAVIFSAIAGVKPYQLGEGLHLNIPFIWVPTKYDIKTLTYTMSGSSGEASGETRHAGEGLVSDDSQVPDDALVALTADGLLVTLDASLRFHIDSDNVWRLHRDIGPEYIDKIVRPQSRSVIRMSFAEFPVVDVYSGKRQVIVEQIQRELRDKFRQSYLILDEVLLRDIRFPSEFQQAIEQKQVALQQAQQMVYEVERAGLEKQQRIIEAEGEAGAVQRKAEALAQNPLLTQYEYIKRLPPDVKIVVTDSKTIISLGDALGGSRSR